MNHSKVIVSSVLAALVLASILVVAGLSASTSESGPSIGNGPVKPVPWKRG